ncbi:MAG: zinc metallopeptidase RseP [Haliea sp.]|jgi:regulator of sigma E protease|uniref:sigma E protease regulator RseP n=1 Tax=Haliea sp. TaxID=1932666 RepID=UPI000C36D5D5|nr:sigma E protease regulator RseP [Haliea sp.]MBM70234.1 zinc metallopeptidase RseP [Haliea sp.]|tara:strand:- start:3619 stop:4974 length:1356 start_codon:yes stop_codon:yes gene_type:complete
MDLAYTIGITLLTLGVLVAVHEFGHFWVARRCGVKVLRFSIGFGKSIYTWQDRHGTEFCIALIPLGGYVKMLDEREGEVAAGERELAFNRKPVLQRIAVVAAGPIANFLLAIVAYWFLFMAGESGYAPVIGAVKPGSVADIAGLEAGQEIVAVDGKETPTWQALSFRLLDRIGDTGTVQFSVKYPDSGMIYESEGQLQQWLGDDESPDLLTGLGITPYAPSVPPVVSEVVADSPAERAGLLPGDRVLSADGTPMDEWLEWVAYVRDRPGQSIALEVQRGNDTVAMQIVPDAETDSAGETIGRVGIAVSMPALPEGMLREFERGPVASLGAAFVRTGDLVGFTLSSIKKMIQGLISPKNLSGPITIAKVASASAKSGLESYIGFLALLSVSLGVLNLLPIPVLDGGHLLYYTVELLAGRPVPEKVQMLGYQLGLFLILGVMALALYNDFARL